MELPESATASMAMSAPVRTIGPTATLEEAHALLLRYGHSGLCVVGDDLTLAGVISRCDIETALRHGLGRSAVADFMSRNVKSAAPTTSLAHISQLMLTLDIGRVPVIKSNRLVGIVTRTDVLRCLLNQQMSLDNSDDSIIRRPTCETLHQQLSGCLKEAWPFLMQLADMAAQRGWSLYVVGGAVRDFLLHLLSVGSALKDASVSSAPVLLSDIDLVVEAADGDLDRGAGVVLAEEIQSQYPDVSLQVYGQFQTASVTWHTCNGKPLVIDIATARTEFYDYPAANPKVEASSLHQDLYRRDFTINAMAIRLSGHVTAQSSAEAELKRLQLVDFFGGWLDLQKCQVKVLHSNSFIEDPTRIFRAVRFAARLGFELEPQTQRLIKYAVNSGVYESVRTRYEKTPALQSRLSAELKYLFSELAWERALALAAQLGALRCIHPDLTLTPALWRQIKRMDRWLTKLHSEAFINKFGIAAATEGPKKWLMLLELIIAQVEPPLGTQVASTLSLPTSSQKRLQNLHLWESEITAQLASAKRPSQLSAALSRYERCELLLIGDRHPYTLGSQIWQYITQVSNQPSLITGRTLQALGYKPSPQFRQILTDVSNLALDGKLTSTQEAQSYVLAHYPRH